MKRKAQVYIYNSLLVPCNKRLLQISLFSPTKPDPNSPQFLIKTMGKTTCCEETGLKKGPWAAEEDIKLIDYIQKHGYGRWRTLPKNAGLQRCGKSCRLRWTNYLRPDIKRGKFSREEEDNIIHLHSLLGNKWSAIAARLPGRTDNEIKNYWNTHIRKRLLRMGIDPLNHATSLDAFRHLSPVSSSSSQHSFNNQPHFPMAYSEEHQTTCFPKLSTLLSSVSSTPPPLPNPLLQINEDVHESVQYSKSAIVDPLDFEVDLYQQQELSGSSSYAMFSSSPSHFGWRSEEYMGGDGYSNFMVDLDFNFYGGWKACS